jgi:glycosyltransferase involved in cell wall biosynthesis
MSVHNGEQYLREAIDSILGQTFKAFEFIIINDGSTDRTAEIIRSYIDPRIRFMSSKANLGLPASLNLGLDVAVGEYIARMDADDVSLSERLEKQVHYMDAHPAVAASGTWAKDIDADGRELGTRCLPVDERMKCDFWRPSPIVHPSAIIRKSHLGTLRYDTRLPYAQDYDLWLGLKARHELANLPEFLLLYRVHPASTTSRHRGSQIRSTHEIAFRRLGLSISFTAFQHLLGILPDVNPVTRFIARWRLARATDVPYRNYLSDDLTYARNWLRSKVKRG